MIRSSALLTAVAMAILIAGVAAANLGLIYLSIAVSILAAVALAVGVLLRRRELFGAATAAPKIAPPGPAAAETAKARPVPVRLASGDQITADGGGRREGDRHDREQQGDLAARPRKADSGTAADTGPARWPASIAAKGAPATARSGGGGPAGRGRAARSPSARAAPARSRPDTAGLPGPASRPGRGGDPAPRSVRPVGTGSRPVASCAAGSRSAGARSPGSPSAQSPAPRAPGLRAASSRADGDPAARPRPGGRPPPPRAVAGAPWAAIEAGHRAGPVSAAVPEPACRGPAARSPCCSRSRRSSSRQPPRSAVIWSPDGGRTGTGGALAFSPAAGPGWALVGAAAASPKSSRRR